MPQTREERNAKRRAQRARATPEEKEKRAAVEKKYREENREEINAKQRARAVTPEGKTKKKTAAAKYREENKEEINAKLRARSATPAGKARAKKNSRAAVLRENPDAREHFYGTDAERVELYLDRTVTVPIDGRAVPGCPPDPCLTGWTGYRNRDGYPVMGVSGAGANVFVHRWLWAETHGPIPKDLFITHLCNNGARGCLTLSHLSADTPKQNAADRVQNRTTRRSLSADQARGIKLMWSMGYTNSQLVEWYRTTPGTINNIISGRSYKEVQVNL